MSMRISSAALLTVLTGCQSDEPEAANLIAQADPADRIACAAPGEPELSRNCIVERAEGPDGPVLTLRHADGGFHRLQVTRDGRGVIAADGAEPARVTLAGEGGIEVAIGGARYRLPATIARRGS